MSRYTRLQEYYNYTAEMVVAPKIMFDLYCLTVPAFKMSVAIFNRGKNCSYPLQALHATKMLVHKIRLWKFF